jgi:uncharacterized protein YoxC
MAWLLLCVALVGLASGEGEADQETLEFFAGNYCLADYCPEHETIRLQGENMETIGGRVNVVSQGLEQLNQQIRSLQEQLEGPIEVTAEERAELQRNMRHLTTQLDGLEEQLQLLASQTPDSPAAQTDLQRQIDANRDTLTSLAELLLRLTSRVQGTVASVEDIGLRLNETGPQIAVLAAKLRKLHVPVFHALFSDEAEVEVPAGSCQLIEITLDVLYESYPYFGGTTYVIVTVNYEPIYGGSEDCDVAMNPAAVTDYTFGAPSRTFYVTDPATLGDDVIVSYDVCRSHISEITPYLTVKCIQTY